MYDEAELIKIRLWVNQYFTFDRAVRPLIYIRAKLSYVTFPHCAMVPGLERERDRPLAYLRDAFLDHPPLFAQAAPPSAGNLRMKWGTTPWPSVDARSIILTVCPGYCTCNRCDELLSTKFEGLQPRVGVMGQHDANYVIILGEPHSPGREG